jgi:HAD superfamily hydrolase (TIGR01484 family)
VFEEDPLVSLRVVPFSVLPPLSPQLLPPSVRSLLPAEYALEERLLLVGRPHARLNAWFTDLDGTLFDQSAEPSLEVAALLAHIVSALTAVKMPIAYVTGRSIANVDRAIVRHGLPMPQYAAASVGTEIFQRGADGWVAVRAWSDHLRSRWPENAAMVLDRTMEKAQVTPCWCRCSTEFRRSYEAVPVMGSRALQQRLTTVLHEEGRSMVQAIVSGSSEEGHQFVDFVPVGGSKADAARFIAQELLGESHLGSVLFTGDSGNDRDLLLAAGAAALVSSRERDLAESLARLRPDLLRSSHANIYGVLHAMFHYGVIAVA